MDPEKLKSNLLEVQRRLVAACQRAGRSPQAVTLVGVTKTVDPAAIESVFKMGVQHFGENRVQEARTKIEQLNRLSPRPTWHMIGHLQSNKVKPCLELFDWIESLDSLPLAQALNQRSARKVQVLLQLNLAAEASKGGFLSQEFGGAFAAIRRLPNLEVLGLMTVAPLVNDPEDVRPLFRQLKHLGDDLGLKHLSMGMTDDFEVAIEEGSTLVRIGRGIFGERSRPAQN